MTESLSITIIQSDRLTQPVSIMTDHGVLQCWSRQLMHWDTFKEGNHSTVGGGGGCRGGEVRVGTTSLIPDHKGFKIQELLEIHSLQQPGLLIDLNRCFTNRD